MYGLGQKTVILILECNFNMLNDRYFVAKNYYIFGVANALKACSQFVLSHS